MRAHFREGPGGFVVSGAAEALRELADRGEREGVAVLMIGAVGGEEIELVAAETEARISLVEAESAWRSLGTATAQ